MKFASKSNKKNSTYKKKQTYKGTNNNRFTPSNKTCADELNKVLEGYKKNSPIKVKVCESSFMKISSKQLYEYELLKAYVNNNTVWVHARCIEDQQIYQLSAGQLVQPIALKAIPKTKRGCIPHSDVHADMRSRIFAKLTQKVALGSDCVVGTLDGTMRNTNALTKRGIPATIYEMNPVTALYQHLVSDDKVNVICTDENGYKGRKIEEYILRMKQEQRYNIISLNLDYCGGMSKNTVKAIKELDNLKVLAINIAKRNNSSEQPNIPNFTLKRMLPTPKCRTWFYERNIL